MSKFLSWLLKIFKKPSPPVVEIPAPTKTPEVPAPVSNPLSQIKKVAIIVGHGHGDSGAQGWNGMSEFNYNSFVAEELEKANLGKEIKVFWRGATGIVGVAAKAVLWNPDLCIELHLNAFDGKAVGCEVLVLDNDTTSARIGKLFAKEFTKKFNRKLRRDEGINWISSGDRGAASLKAVSPIKYSILVEPFFIDNPNEWIEPIEYIKFLINLIREV